MQKFVKDILRIDLPYLLLLSLSDGRIFIHIFEKGSQGPFHNAGFASLRCITEFWEKVLHEADLFSGEGGGRHS